MGRRSDFGGSTRQGLTDQPDVTAVVGQQHREPAEHRRAHQSHERRRHAHRVEVEAFRARHEFPEAALKVEEDREGRLGGQFARRLHRRHGLDPALHRRLHGSGKESSNDTPLEGAGARLSSRSAPVQRHLYSTEIPLVHLDQVIDVLDR